MPPLGLAEAASNNYGAREIDLIDRSHRMADIGVPHFHNDAGARSIRIGAKEFMCIGAKPPLDHPHVFLDMGADREIICPYCSTLFVYEPSLHGAESDPAGCAWSAKDDKAAA
jgi:uncharacterized Zn-finger protein